MSVDGSVASVGRGEGRWPRRLWKATSSSGTALAGSVIVLVFLVAAIAAPVISPDSPLHMVQGQELKPPSWGHLLGTDEFGRDILSRVIFGARVSLAVGLGGVLTATVAGIVLGLISGYSGPGSIIDTIAMRSMDTLLAFPAILIGIIVIVILGPRAVNVAIAVAIANVPLVTRLVRAEVLRERERDYVQAAQALGARQGRILFRHLLPNVFSIIVTQITTSLATAVLMEAALSFLGMGAQPPTPSWGVMLRDSRSYLQQAPWYVIGPGAALTLMVVGMNYFAQVLRAVTHRR